MQLTTRWPAYALPAGSRLRTTLLEAAHAFGADVEATLLQTQRAGRPTAGLMSPHRLRDALALENHAQ